MFLTAQESSNFLRLVGWRAPCILYQVSISPYEIDSLGMHLASPLLIIVTSYSSMVSTCLFSAQHGSNSLWASLLSPWPLVHCISYSHHHYDPNTQLEQFEEGWVHLGSQFQRIGFSQQGKQGGVYIARKYGKTLTWRQTQNKRQPSLFPPARSSFLKAPQPSKWCC